MHINEYISLGFMMVGSAAMCYIVFLQFFFPHSAEIYPFKQLRCTFKKIYLTLNCGDQGHWCKNNVSYRFPNICAFPKKYACISSVLLCLPANGYIASLFLISSMFSGNIRTGGWMLTVLKSILPTPQSDKIWYPHLNCDLLFFIICTGLASLPTLHLSNRRKYIFQ